MANSRAVGRNSPPDEYEVSDAAHTLKRAHAIRKDKRLMKHVKKHVRREAADMNQLAQALQGGGQAQTLQSAFGPG